MQEAKDAKELISTGNYEIEKVYADYANKMKTLANKARKDSLSVQDTPYSKHAETIYKKEVTSLKHKLDDSAISASLERQALRTATVIVNQRVASYPERYNKSTTDGKAHLRKMKNQVINQQRTLLGKPKPFDITDREWEAIQAGALHKTLVAEIIAKADQTRVKELSTPKTSKLPVITNSKIAHAKAMLNSGFTASEVADELGISTATLYKYI